MKKEVQIRGSSPIFLGEEVPWADLWIQVKQRRETVYLAPCFSGSLDLRGDRKVIEKAMEYADNAETLAALQEDLSQFDRIIRDFDEGKALHMEKDDRPGCTCDSVFVNRPALSKACVEEALVEYLEFRGIKAPCGLKFRWKTPKIFCDPVSFGGGDEAG